VYEKRYMRRRDTERNDGMKERGGRERRREAQRGVREGTEKGVLHLSLQGASPSLHTHLARPRLFLSPLLCY